jgi:hypothetical protein
MRSEIALKDNRIDDLTRAAIGEEMGDRLRMLLPGQSERLPRRMMMLIEQVAANHRRGPPVNRNTRADRKTEVAQ